MAAPLILVVEDEPLVALTLQKQLEHLGYTVPAPAATGEEAIRQVVRGAALDERKVVGLRLMLCG